MAERELQYAKEIVWFAVRYVCFTVCSINSGLTDTPIFIATWDELNLWMCKWKSYLAALRELWPQWLSQLCSKRCWCAVAIAGSECRLKLSALAFITRSPHPFGSRTQISAFRTARFSDHSTVCVLCFIHSIFFCPVVVVEHFVRIANSECAQVTYF